MPINISASLIEDFISCNRKVLFRLHRPEVAVQNREMVIGEVTHSAIEKFWDNNMEMQKYVYAELTKRLNDDFPAIEFASQCLNRFTEHFYPLLTDKDKIEKRFRIPIEKDVFLVGKMDRISNSSVFDWKTSRTVPKSLTYNPQFIVYNWAYEQIYKSPPAGVYFGSLTTGNLIMYKQDAVAEDALFSAVIPHIVAAIRGGDYVPNGIFKGACYRCSYSSTCLKEWEDGMDSPTSTEK